MDERHLSLLQQIVDELNTTNSTLDEVNRGIAMLINKAPDRGLVEKLDEVGGVVGDIESKMGGSSMLFDALSAIQSSLDNLPAEIAAGVSR